MTDANWGQRMLCPDGACVGVIGPAGTCKVCGRVAPGWGDERNRGLAADDDNDAADDDAADDADDADDDGDHTPLPAPAPTDGHDDVARPRGEDWSDRRLCENGACIGVIGSDGRCKVCGTLDAGGPDEPADGDDVDDEDDADAEASEDADEDGDGDDEDADADADADAEERKLCPDGTCVGVIGAGGRCKLCGREAEA